MKWKRIRTRTSKWSIYWYISICEDQWSNHLWWIIVLLWDVCDYYSLFVNGNGQTYNQQKKKEWKKRIESEKERRNQWHLNEKKTYTHTDESVLRRETDRWWQMNRCHDRKYVCKCTWNILRNKGNIYIFCLSIKY